MQLYKSRDFGAFFQDTFAFIRQNGGHLFKNFFIINGIFILILMVLGYFLSQFYTEILFGSLSGGDGSAIEAYLNENGATVALFLFLLITIGFLSLVISYAYMPIYLKLYAKNNNTSFTSSDLINEYKAHIGKILIYLLTSILVAIPVFIIAGLTSFILIITIVGMLLLPLVFGGINLFYQGTLMEYIEGKKGIWESYSYSLGLISSNFWAAVGCVGLFVLMSYIVQNIVTLIPYMALMAEMITGVEAGTSADPNTVGKSALIWVIVMFLLNYIFGLFLNLIMQLNQGIVFYSLKEERENINTKSDIDLIGSGE